MYINNEDTIVKFVCQLFQVITVGNYWQKDEMKKKKKWKEKVEYVTRKCHHLHCIESIHWICCIVYCSNWAIWKVKKQQVCIQNLMNKRKTKQQTFDFEIGLRKLILIQNCLGMTILPGSTNEYWPTKCEKKEEQNN